MSEAPLSATSGVGELDRALDGLYWGDNVVWEAEDSAAVDPFLAAVAETASGYHFAGYFSLAADPADVKRRYPTLDVIDARPSGPLGQPGPLLAEVRRRCDPMQRDLLLFDPLAVMASRWGEETALRFFTRTCPLLLEFGAVAYWVLAPSAHPQATRREIEQVTQCVVTLGDGRLRIVKAEARPPGVEGSVYHYRIADGRPELTAAPAAARLGAALKAVRVTRGLSQTDLARFAGVSPSAVSQAERGQRGLSLETLLELSSKLNITLDELLRGEVAPGYRLGRRHDPRERAEGRVLSLLDDPAAGLRAFVVRIPPGAATSPPSGHKGLELIAVAIGLVQVSLGSGRAVLRSGETLLAERTGVTAWRNLGDREAMVFWILRDETSGAVVDSARG